MLFSSLAAGFAWSKALPSGYSIEEAIEDINIASHWRCPYVHALLICMSVDQDGSVTRLFSHTLDPSIEIAPFRGLTACRFQQVKRLAQKQLDAIVEDVRRSTDLTVDQRDIMMEDIRSWPVLGHLHDDDQRPLRLRR